MTTADDLFGTWSLVAAYVDIPGAPLHYLGEAPRGRLILDRTGWMCALLTARDRDAAAGPAALFGSMIAYSGRFTVDATRFATVVDAAWLPAWVGTTQVRDYVVAGDRLTLRSAIGRHPASPDADAATVLDWRRDG